MNYYPRKIAGSAFCEFYFNISPIFSESWKLHEMRIKVPRSEFHIRAISFKTVLA